MESIKEEIKDIISENIDVKNKLIADKLADIENLAKIITDCYKNKKKVLVCGNGGSAADAQHIAGELVGRFKLERRGLSCIALSTDTSIMTAWSNDYEFNTVFSRQVEALGDEGDILIAISTSGNSPNIIKAIEEAKKIGMKTVSLIGKDGGNMKGMCNLDIVVECNNTPRVQEAHMLIYHIMCELVEKELFK